VTARFWESQPSLVRGYSADRAVGPIPSAQITVAAPARTTTRPADGRVRVRRATPRPIRHRRWYRASSQRPDSLEPRYDAYYS